MTTPNTPAPWMDDEQILKSVAFEDDALEVAKRIRDLAAQHYEPLLEAWEMKWATAMRYKQEMEAQLAAKSKDVEELKGRLSVYPMVGYAPGNYSCQCATCGTQFIGDKRAVQCNKCGYESSVLRYKSENATLKAEVERLKGEKDAWESEAESWVGFYDEMKRKHDKKHSDWNDLNNEITRLKADVTGFAEWAFGYYVAHWDVPTQTFKMPIPVEQAYQEYLKQKQ